MRGGTTDINAFFLSNAAKVSAVEIIGFYQTVLGVWCNGMYHVEGMHDEPVFCTSLFQTNWSSEHSFMQCYVKVQKELLQEWSFGIVQNWEEGVQDNFWNTVLEYMLTGHCDNAKDGDYPFVLKVSTYA